MNKERQILEKALDALIDVKEVANNLFTYKMAQAIDSINDQLRQLCDEYGK